MNQTNKDEIEFIFGKTKRNSYKYKIKFKIESL